MVVVLPIGRLKLVLDVEEPYANDRGDERHWQLDEEQTWKPNGQREEAHQQYEYQVRQVNATPRTLLARGEIPGEAVLDNELKRWANQKHQAWVPIESIGKLPMFGECKIFLNRQRGNIAPASAIKVASRGMMDCVRLAPVCIRSECNDSEQEAESIVRSPGGKEGPMTTIMLNNEQAYQKTSGWHREKERDPVPVVEAIYHEAPEQHIREGGRKQLPET
jgi:hypothetical protein